MLPASTLRERLPAEFLSRALHAGVTLGTEQVHRAGFLPFGVGSLTPEQGILLGQVTELSVGHEGAQATTLALGACAEAQRQGRIEGIQLGQFCAFVDPAASLYAPGVEALGVELSRLLVVRPPPTELAAVTLRLVRSRIFGLLVVDTVGVPGQPMNVDWRAWVRVVRQMNLALEGTVSSVLLITDARVRRPLPLPVARRIELLRPNASTLRVRIVKDRCREHGQGQSMVHESPTFVTALRRSA